MDLVLVCIKLLLLRSHDLSRRAVIGPWAVDTVGFIPECFVSEVFGSEADTDFCPVLTSDLQLVEGFRGGPFSCPFLLMNNTCIIKQGFELYSLKAEGF